MEPTKLFETLGEAQQRLIRDAFPMLEEDDTLSEGPALRQVIATAQALCGAGDEAMCCLMRDWTWQGALAMLESAGVDTLGGGFEDHELYADFVGGISRIGSGTPQEGESLAEVIPFPSTS